MYKKSSNYTEYIRCHDKIFSPLRDLAPGFVQPCLKQDLAPGFVQQCLKQDLAPDFVQPCLKQDLAQAFVQPSLKISLHNYSQSVMISDLW
jgi:hypothetical protein